ncbi:MAG TPA: hypothetical protein VJS20_07685, partial [Gemmatimonadales bacterium]|nr:hypothetical protein [Gemmatimonadales bacterium]
SPNTVANGRVVRFADNTPPNDPTGLAQAGDAAGTARPLGYVSDSTMYFQGTVTDPDAGNQLGLEVEVLPSSTAFTSNSSGTIVRTDAADMVSDGQVAEAALDFTTAGLPSGNYHWRARTIDEGGGTSDWVLFNAAAIHFATDFVPPSPPGGPLTPDGVQLVFSAPAGDVSFSWGGATDTGPPGPIAYRLQISVTNTFGSTVYDSTIAAQSADVNLTAMDTPYYWRVMAVDQAGNEGSPSSTAFFQVSWTTTVPDGANDRYAHCGTATGSGSLFTMMVVVAALAALLGLNSLKR